MVSCQLPITVRCRRKITFAGPSDESEATYQFGGTVGAKGNHITPSTIRSPLNDARSVRPLECDAHTVRVVSEKDFSRFTAVEITARCSVPISMLVRSPPKSHACSSLGTSDFLKREGLGGVHIPAGVGGSHALRNVGSGRSATTGLMARLKAFEMPRAKWRRWDSRILQTVDQCSSTTSASQRHASGRPTQGAICLICPFILPFWPISD
jgi:hypothetical protein